jgi:hypothetical protein
MTPEQFEKRLHHAIEFAWEVFEEQRDERIVRAVQTFEERGILTRDRGLVVTFTDGSEIQVTLVQSRRGRDEGDE